VGKPKGTVSRCSARSESQWVAATFLERFAATIRADTHAVLVLDQAGWHGSHQLVIPEAVSLVPLPAYRTGAESSDFGSICASASPIASSTATMRSSTPAAMLEQPHRQTGFQSLCAYPWITKVSSWARRDENSSAFCLDGVTGRSRPLWDRWSSLRMMVCHVTASGSRSRMHRRGRPWSSMPELTVRSERGAVLRSPTLVISSAGGV
jgi:hypothetical protein